MPDRNNKSINLHNIYALIEILKKITTTPTITPSITPTITPTNTPNTPNNVYCKKN